MAIYMFSLTLKSAVLVAILNICPVNKTKYNTFEFAMVKLQIKTYSTKCRYISCHLEF